MAAVVRMLVMALIFFLPGGSLILAGYAAHALAIKQRALAPVRRPTSSPRLLR